MSYDSDGSILLDVSDGMEDATLTVSYVANKPNGGIAMKNEQASGEYDSLRGLYVFDPPYFEDSYNDSYTVYGTCDGKESVRLAYRS